MQRSPFNATLQPTPPTIKVTDQPNRKRQQVASAEKNGVAASDRTIKNSRQSSSSTDSAQFARDLDEKNRPDASARLGVVPKLERDRWLVPHDHSSGLNDAGQRRQDQSGNREISSFEPESPIKRIIFQSHSTNQTDRTNGQRELPLIHTDHLNTSSPLLYVHSSRQNQQRLHSHINNHHNQSHRQQARIQLVSDKLHQSSDQDQAADSSMSSAQILSATGPPVEQLAAGADSLSNRSDEPTAKWVPRFGVLNLEVGSSTVTLTWTLAMFHADELPVNGSPSIVMSDSGGGDKAGPSVQQVTSIVGFSKVAHDRPANDQISSLPPPATVAVNESLSQRQEAPSGRQQKRADKGSAESLNQAEQSDQQGDSGPPIGHTEPSGSSYGSSRLIVKRDTIRVTPTLGRQSSLGASQTRRHRPNEETDKGVDEGGRGRAGDQVSEIKRSSDHNELVNEEDEGQLDLLRTKMRREDAGSSFSTVRMSASTPSTSTAATTSAPDLMSELSLGKRLQLSHVRSLPASSHNRRPPLRATINEDDNEDNNGGLIDGSVSEAPIRSPEAMTTASSIQTTSSSTTRGVAVVDRPEARRPLRFVSRRKSRPVTSTTSSTSTTTTTTTTTTTPAPDLTERPAGEEIETTTSQRGAGGASTPVSVGDESEARQATTTTKAPRAAKSLSRENPITTERPPSLFDTTPVLPDLIVATPTSTESPADARSPPATLNAESTTKSIRLIEPPAGISGSTLSQVNIIRQQQTAHAMSTGESSIRAVTSSSQLPADNSSFSKVVDSSKWLVRLRRFASNEVDIVKVVVNNLSHTNPSHQLKAVMRYITFTELEPSSAYELCVESASPNQQVGDRFQVLDANHFLKCSDTSDVELSHGSQEGPGIATGTSSIRRMDFSSSATWSPLDIAQLTDGKNRNDSRSAISPSTGTGADGVKIDHQYHPSEDSQFKVKSLCKEFLTLPANSTGKINFGLHGAGATRGGNSQQPIQPSKPESSSSAGGSQLNNNSLAMANPRRAKSLNNALKSRIELLEINDFNELMANNQRPQSMIFEMASSRASGARLASTGSDNYVTRIESADDHLASGSGSGGSLLPSGGHNGRDYMTMSLLPIIGCIFGIIFIITLANIILSAVSCRSLRARRRRSAGNAGMMATRSGMLAHQHSLIGQSSVKHNLGSFYGSDRSDHSGTSQSRMVVVGNNGEPFGAGSAYFEVPNESATNRAYAGGAGEQSSSAGSSNGSGGKHSSSFLLSSSTRFPLGPSFEGDEKHNADMVGLARKNYDNFINHIYNNGLQAEQVPASRKTAALGGNQSLTLGAHQDLALDGKQRSHHDHHHHHHSRHYHHNTLHESQLADQSTSRPTRADREDIQPKEAEETDKSPPHENSTNDQQGKGKRQRIRFDKINPIYNMDGLYSTSRGGVISSSRRLKSPIGVSSFGHTNPVPIMEEGDERKSESTSSSDFDLQCPLCRAESAIDPQSEQVDTVPQHCEVDGNCHEDTYFTCCLDKQKQRFRKQQQQLERVMTKNGSLVPQPFINPIGPPRCGSPSCESIVREHDQQLAAAVDPLQQQVAHSSSSPLIRDKTSLDSVDLISQHDKEDQEVVEVPKNNNQEEDNTKPKDFFIFGEDTNHSELNGNQVADIRHNQTPVTMPSPPEPPSPLPPSSPTPDNNNQNRETLVKIVAMGQVAKQSRQPYDAINKNDFNQRRTELASKLHLTGMMKPSP